MDALTDLQIMDLAKALTCKKAAHEILANFLPLISQTRMHSEKLHDRSHDFISKSLLPSDFKDWIPIKTTGDGNCLFNAMSTALSGNESLSSVLRLLTVAELFAYSEFYADHPQIADIAQVSSYSKHAILNIFLSDQKAEKTYSGNIDNVPRAIEVLAQETAKPFVFSSHFHILALASVISKPIQSVYPDIPSCRAIQNLLHRVVATSHIKQEIWLQ